jgi:peptidoglycan/xylan/chitin deacetylase (PgdA/CDA1 family)
MTEILAYHNISNDNLDLCTVAPSFFQSEMEWLAEQGYMGISLKEFYKDIEQKDVFVLTFDDGYKDFFNTAIPILDKFNFKATIFIVSKLIGDICYWRTKRMQPRLLDWDEIHSIINMGHEIGSHGLYHRNYLHLSKEELEQEIAGSKKLIEKKLGIPIVSFSYPWSRYNDRILEAVKKANYEYACINAKECKNDFKTNRLHLCRREMGGRNSIKEFFK